MAQPASVIWLYWRSSHSSDVSAAAVGWASREATPSSPMLDVEVRELGQLAQRKQQGGQPRVAERVGVEVKEPA